MKTPTTFEWDDDKAAANVVKHGIRFEVAVLVFLDENRLDEVDGRDYAYGEERRNAIGMADGTCVNVAYTMRGTACRIISARRAHRKERNRYEKA